VGTHALVQQATTFARLGFAAVDEQHRFGVEQRKALAAKGRDIDVLLMTATPIPRSLALTLYGDLDVSVLDEKPPGRRPITSALRPESARERVLRFVDGEVEKGRQAYVVYPLVEESEKSDLKAATVAYEELTAGALAHRRVGLLHGACRRRQGRGDARVPRRRARRARRDDGDRGRDRRAQRDGDAHRAPRAVRLSQLHQLRGRVGRGGEQSYCILLGDVGPDAAERLRLFVSTEDGFEIARADLRLRGMGDLFGERQSGEATFRVADPLRDEELNLHAREAAERLLTDDPELTRPEHQGLRQTLGARYARSLELFRVG
jgi:ATP-dependent DNA helicase RecG